MVFFLLPTIIWISAGLYLLECIFIKKNKIAKGFYAIIQVNYITIDFLKDYSVNDIFTTIVFLFLHVSE